MPPRAVISLVFNRLIVLPLDGSHNPALVELPKAKDSKSSQITLYLLPNAKEAAWRILDVLGNGATVKGNPVITTPSLEPPPLF